MSVFADSFAGMFGLLFFFALFVGIAFWALAPQRKEKLESLKFIPLQEEK